MAKDKKEDKKKKDGDKKEKKDKKVKDGDGKKEKKEKKAKAADESTPATSDAAASGPAADIFAKFDTGGKGYLDKNEVSRLLAEMQGGGPGQTLGYAPPRIGPFATNGAGAMFPYNSGGLGMPGTGIYGPGMRGGSAFGYGGGGLGSTSSTASPGRPLAAGAPSYPGRFGATFPSVTAAGALLPQQQQSPGPDQNAVALAQAYQTRLAALSTVAASLLSKRESIALQLARVQGRQAEVAAAREAIEAETLADTEAILHRLRAVEASKQAVLTRDAEVLVGDIMAIDRFYGVLTSYQPRIAGGGGGVPAAASSPATAGDGGLLSPASSTAIATSTGLGSLYDPSLALEFMRAYPELCAEADRLTGKGVKGDVDVGADDFERETASRLDLASKYTALVDLVAAKDRIILQMLKERESSMRDREASLQREASYQSSLKGRENDVAHWTKLVDALTRQLVEATDRLASAQGMGMGGHSSDNAGAMVAMQQQQQPSYSTMHTPMGSGRQLQQQPQAAPFTGSRSGGLSELQQQQLQQQYQQQQQHHDQGGSLPPSARQTPSRSASNGMQPPSAPAFSNNLNGIGGGGGGSSSSSVSQAGTPTNSAFIARRMAEVKLTAGSATAAPAAAVGQQVYQQAAVRPDEAVTFSDYLQRPMPVPQQQQQPLPMAPEAAAGVVPSGAATPGPAQQMDGVINAAPTAAPAVRSVPPSPRWSASAGNDAGIGGAGTGAFAAPPKNSQLPVLST